MTIRISLAFIVLVLANASRPAEAAEVAGPVLRKTNYLAVLQEASGKAGMVIESQQYSPVYSDVLGFVLTGPESNTLSMGEVSLGEQLALTFPGKTNGLHVLELDSGWNACRIVSAEAPLAYVAREIVPLHTARGVKQFFFYAPGGCREFSIWLAADTPREGARIEISGPDGRSIVEEEGDYDKPQRVRVGVPAGGDGKVWSLSLRKPKAAGLNVDDVTLWLDAALPPYLSTREDWALAFGKRKHP